MSENLHVNSNSSVLEHKRKHNLLVDEVLGIENGNVNIPNAKPIYCHPISIDYQGDTGNLFHLALLIFDNSNEEYNTYEKFIAKLNAIFALNPSAVFPITGALYYTSGSALHIAQKIGYSSNSIKVFTVRPNGTQGDFDQGTTLAQEGVVFYDGVNPLNVDIEETEVEQGD